MILKVDVPGAASDDLGDEIWQQPLEEAIRAEADAVLDHVGSERDYRERHQVLRELLIAEMSRALVGVGDSYRAPDGVLYALVDEAPWAAPGEGDSLSAASSDLPGPVVAEVLRVEDPPLGSLGSRRAVVRWSDGS